LTDEGTSKGPLTGFGCCERIEDKGVGEGNAHYSHEYDDGSEDDGERGVHPLPSPYTATTGPYSDSSDAPVAVQLLQKNTPVSR